MADEKMLRHTLDLARGAVHRGQSPLALEHLRSVFRQIEDLPGTSLRADYYLIFAGALAGMGEHGAEAAFADAFQRISELEEPHAELQFRAYNDYARYLTGEGRTSAALANYKSAEAVAVEAGMLEDAARVYLCVVRIDLESNRDPRLAGFQNLKKAAKDVYTAREQQTTWVEYCEDMKESGHALIAARLGNVASVDYFRGKLSSVRHRSNEAAD